MLRERFHSQNGNRGINLPHGPTNEVRGRAGITAGVGREFDLKEDVALEPAGKRKIERAVWILFEQIGARVRHDANDLNLSSRLGALSWRRILFCELNLLSQGIAIGPEFPGQHLVDDGNGRRSLMHRFRHVEGPTAQEGQAHGLEVIRAHAVPVRTEGQTFRGSGGLRVWCRIGSAALNRFAE